MKTNTLRKAGRLIQLCMSPYKGQYIWAIVLNIVGSILGTLNPFIIGFAITELGKNVKDIMAGVPGAGINLNYILTIVLILIISAVIRQGGTYVASYMLAGGVQDSFRDLRTSISRKMNRLPVSYFDKHQLGTVLNNVTNDVDAVTNAMQQSLLPLVYAVTNITMTFVMMMVISLPLGLLCLLMIPGAYFISRAMMRRSQNQFRKMQNTLAELNGYIQERYTGFTVTKLYNNEQKTVEKFQEINGELNQAGFKSGFISSLMSPLMELLINITYVIMMLLTGYAVLFSGMPLGNMQAFVQYIWLVYEPIGQITQLSTAVQSAAASMERIVTFLEEPEESDDSDKIASVNLEEFKGHVSFKEVQFSYDKSSTLLTDLTVDAKPGQTIAIVGATGAGKTTIINLLMRFYDIDAGDISIDGTSIYDMRRSAERSLFGMVLQDAWLYHATIAENIRFGRLDATDEEVIEAAKTANVHHFIKTLPGGYNMMINEEASNVSLGQKQLLTIARAILADPRILILDEATSSVDTRLEMLIQVAMKQAMQNRTSFVIAHRLSTIRDADMILVLEKGDIVEQGTHQQLLDLDGKYAALYNSQFAEE
ncbi:MAG: ABC transporter ATP-binding protein [Oscillospiraceae bacterium]